MTNPIRSGRGWAYTGAALGGLVSIAANVAHSFIPPKQAPADWAPEPGAVVGAIVWPVFLFVAVEILARVAWPHGRTWQAVRRAGILPVAVVAALVSYRHLSGLLAHYGEETIVSILGPLAVDGLMVMATGALIATSRHRTTTVTAPAAAAPSREPVPTAPPFPPDTPAPTPAPSVVDTAPIRPPAPASSPAPVRPEIPTPAELAGRITPPRTTDPPAGPAAASRTAAARKPSPRPRKPATPPAPKLAPSATDTSVTAPDAAQLALPVVSPDLLARATQVAGQYRTEHGTPITAGQLAVRLKVTTSQATQALAVLDLGPDSPTTPIPTVNGNPVKVTR